MRCIHRDVSQNESLVSQIGRNITRREVRMVRIVLEVLGVLAVAAAPVVAADAASGSVVPPTFSRDVAPIFQQKCQACHRPDSIAPMSLVTYEDVRPWARSIR